MTTPIPRALRTAKSKAFRDAKRHDYIRVQHACQVLQAAVGVHSDLFPLSGRMTVPTPPKPHTSAEIFTSFTSVPTEASVVSSAEQTWWDSFDTSGCLAGNSDVVQSDHDSDHEPEAHTVITDHQASDNLVLPVLEQYTENAVIQTAVRFISSPLPEYKSHAAPVTPQNHRKGLISTEENETSSVDTMSSITEPHAMEFVEPTTPKDASVSSSTDVLILGIDALHFSTPPKILSRAVSRLSIAKARMIGAIEDRDIAKSPSKQTRDLKDATTYLLHTPFSHKDKPKGENIQPLSYGTVCSGHTTELLPEIILELLPGTILHWQPVHQLPMRPVTDLPSIEYQQEAVRSQSQPVYWRRDLVSIVNLWLRHCDTSIQVLDLAQVHLTALPTRGGRDTLCHGIHASVESEASSIRFIHLMLPKESLGAFSRNDETEWYVLHIKWNQGDADSFTLLVFQASVVTQTTFLDHGGSRILAGQAFQGSACKLLLGKPGSMPAACGHGMDEWALEEFMSACARGDGVITMTPRVESQS